MKKVLSFLLIALMLINSNLAVFAANDNKGSDEAYSEEYLKDLDEAKAVLNILAGDEIFREEIVTRADFIMGLFKFLKYESSEVTEAFFTDVRAFDAIAPYIYQAVNLGWIARADKFEPDRPIRTVEALKILNRVTGFGFVAERNGAYPYGDIYVGRQKGITKNINISEDVLDKDTAYLLLFRAAAVSTFRQVSFGKDAQYSDDGDSLLKQVYDVDIYKGVISRTPYNTLSGMESGEKSRYAEIDGIRYACDHIDWDMLGVYSRVYVSGKDNGSEERIVYACDLSDRISVPLIDVDKKEGDRVYYYKNNGSRKYLRLSSSVTVVFNGRKITAGIDSVFESNIGEVVFVDNDKDGNYDVVFVNKYDYMCALEYDSLSESLRDAYSNKRTFKFEDKVVVIEDENGEELNPLDIEEDDVFRVVQSNDGIFIYLQKCGDKINGALKIIDETNKKITIGETEYDMSDYFMDNFSHQYTLGAEGVFTVDNGTVVMCTVKLPEMLYGYLTDCFEYRRDNCIKLKIFTQSGNFETFSLRRNKILLDGVRYDDAYVYSKLTDSENNTITQLIKFGISASGEINKIDTATTTLPTKPGIYPEAKDSLTYYSGLSGNLQYSSNSQGMGEKFNCSNSMIFCIPNDLDDTNEFKVGGKGMFAHDHYYNVDVYDIDESGCAKVLLYRGAADYINADKPAMIISKIFKKLDEDNETVYGIDGWCDGVFATYTLAEDFAVSKINSGGTVVKSSHESLSGGDIIAYSADDKNRIKAINVVFDARKGIMSNNNSIFNSDTKAAPMYYEGMVYDVKAGYAVISITKTSSGYDFSQSSLRYVRLGTIKLAYYNADTCELREIDVNDIKTYKTDGTNAYYGVFCLSNHSLKSAFFYEDMEGRK